MLKHKTIKLFNDSTKNREDLRFDPICERIDGLDFIKIKNNSSAKEHCQN